MSEGTTDSRRASRRGLMVSVASGQRCEIYVKHDYEAGPVDVLDLQSE